MISHRTCLEKRDVSLTLPSMIAKNIVFSDLWVDVASINGSAEKELI